MMLPDAKRSVSSARTVVVGRVASGAKAPGAITIVDNTTMTPLGQRPLDLGIDIIPGETVREADGLAMSSRNAYLTAEDRTRAAELNKIIFALAAELRQGEPLAVALETARASAENAFDAVDYLEVRQASTLAPIEGEKVDGPARVLATVRLGDTRLLDNCAV